MATIRAITPRPRGRIEVAVEHEGIGYSFSREYAVDWSAVDACYPIRDEDANRAYHAAMAAVLAKHAPELQKWVEEQIGVQVAAAAAAKVEADARAVEEERKAKILAYIAANPKDAAVVSVLSKAVPVAIAPIREVR